MGAKVVAKRRRFYVPVKVKFLIAILAAAGWATFSYFISRPWLHTLGSEVGRGWAFVIILFIALIPGFLVTQLLVSIILDHPPLLDLEIDYPPVSILIAAYNEEENLPETFRGLRGLDYPGQVEIIVVDDGSTDGTVEVLKSQNIPRLVVIEAEHGGKAHALNLGLEHVTSDIMITIDADTFMHPQSVRRIVARMLQDPEGTAAVAGSVLVKNSRASLMSRLQEWDYFVAISSVKRQQALYQGALVAQGAFSAFDTAAVREQQGWPSVIGEDIVLTWALLKSGYRIGYESTAVGFTLTPSDIKGFLHQRKRWARGMIEGLKRHGNMIWKRPRLSAFFVAVDFLFPLLDLFYTFVFIPGIILACTGRFYIVGPMTLLVLPLAIIVVLIMYRKERKVFDELGLKVRRNRFGVLVYLLGYQFLMSPICVVGYTQELLGFSKRW
jgi:biofilm PGA synthesis N-glycosyltransferase PgaC